MYKAFYGLREKPFNLTPDPRFLYLSEKHKEAFAHLLYGIRNRAGFVMVTGEIGTGKTTICRNLLNQLDEDTELAFIFNPMLSPLELLKKIVSEFGIDARGTNALELTEELNEYLLEAAAKGKNCVLLIDEAQNLDPQVLEQIRLLSNLETETEKLLQIVLIGQPELGEKLALHELRQLNQRITARYHLKPLSEKEVLHYVAYRLHVAGGRRQVKFARRAVRAVYKISKGTPRVINAICDRALLIGFTKEVRVITASIVYRAYREIRGDAVFGKKSPRWTLRQLLWNPVAAIALLCVFVALYLNSPALQARGNALATQIARAIPKPAEDLPTTEKSPEKQEAIPAPNATAPQSTPATTTPATITLPIPAVPTATPLTQTLETALAAVPKAESDAAALTLMLQAWGRAVPATLPSLSDDNALEDFIQTQSWSHDRLTPALDQLLALDLPAFVKVVAGTGTRWVTVSKAEGENLTLSATPAAPVTVSRAEFQRVYASEAIVPWRDALPGAPVMRQGQQAPAVAQLKEKLHHLNRLRPENTGDTYDVETASAVARIQAETSLDVDGIAGKQFRMVLSSWIKEAGVPSLTGKYTAAPELQTLASTAPAEPKPEVKPEPKAEPKAEQKAEPKAEQKPEPKPEPKAEPKPEVKPEPEAVPEPPAPAPATSTETSTPVEATPAADAAPAASPEVPAAEPVTLTNIGKEGPKAAEEATPAAPSQPTNPLDPTPPAPVPPAAAATGNSILAVQELSDPGQLVVPETPAPAPAPETPPATVDESTSKAESTPAESGENKG